MKIKTLHLYSFVFIILSSLPSHGFPTVKSDSISNILFSHSLYNNHFFKNLNWEACIELPDTNSCIIPLHPPPGPSELFVISWINSTF